MSNATDMSTPVTRGELREELDVLRQEMATKFDWWGGALLERIKDSETRFDAKLAGVEERLSTELVGAEKRLSAELAQHAKALHESMEKLISGSYERFADLPGRVSRLETAVFPDKRR